MAIVAGQLLGVYEVRGRLGAGGMGEVWLARDLRLNREVALKVLPSALTHEPEAKAGFRREALLLASLNHPNIATLHGLEETPDGEMLLVLERIEGETLAQRLVRGAPTLEESLRICVQIAQALEAAHERGVIHRDLKPGNVMIGPRGRTKVLDFGLAAQASDPAWTGQPAAPGTPPVAPAASLSTGTSLPTPTDLVDTPTEAVVFSAPDGRTTSGTPGYMSPEQVLAGAQDERVDMFAFGCVLLECLTGRPAFRTDLAIEAMRRTLESEADLSGLPAETRPEVRELIRSCLQKDPQSRMRSAGEAREVLERALGIRTATGPDTKSLPATPHNLPAPATSFVEREVVVRTATQILVGSRLVTFTAIGGAGKTRLALHLAESQLEAHPDGVWFIDLAPVAEPERVVAVVASVLRVVEEPGRALVDSIAEHLAASRVLLVLDNCEELREACALLAGTLLRAAPGLRILTTSREPLGVAGETLFPVPPMTVPEAGAGADAVRTAESVELFVERATAVSPGFELTGENAAAVAEICRRLDGIPLAVELAAARVRLLSIEQIRDRLDDRFRLLGSGAGSGSSRQQTLLTVIRWSWDQLAAPEQELLSRLSVFVGGWTLERAAAVCLDSGDEFEMLDLLTRLVERSLVTVQRREREEPRYRLLESVWRFARDQFESRPEFVVIRGRHVECYVALSRVCEQGLNGPDNEVWRTVLADEEANVLEALDWCASMPGGSAFALTISVGCVRYWVMNGRFDQALRALEGALRLDHGGNRIDARRAYALMRSAGIYLTRGAYAEGRQRLEEAAEINETLGAPSPAVLAGLAVAAMAESRIEDSLAINRRVLELYRKVGATRGVAMTLHNIGTCEAWLRRYAEGRAHHEEAVDLIRTTGDEVTLVLALAGLASVLCRSGDCDAARPRLIEAREIQRRLPSIRETVYLLETTAEYLACRGSFAAAVRLEAAAGACREERRMPHMAYEKDDAEEFRTRLLAALGREAYDAEMLVGRALGAEAALALVAEELGGV